jgi:ABC-type antimicrobial peptide transport system permease subunit
MDDVLAASVGQERFTMSLLLTFGIVALGLAVIGVYGIQSFVVSHRTREFGVRMALGATPGEVMRLVVRQGVTLAAIGIAFGILAAAWLTAPLGSMLYEVGVRDLAIFTTVPLMLAVVAALASLVPAQRAVAADHPYVRSIRPTRRAKASSRSRGPLDNEWPLMHIYSD